MKKFPPVVHTQDLQSNDEDIELVENCYEESSNLNDEERSSLYYISGYVAFKENHGIQVEESETLPRNSEFLQLVSRGKLAHPTPELYDLSLITIASSKHERQNDATRYVCRPIS